MSTTAITLMCVFFGAVVVYSVYLLICGTPDPHFSLYQSFLLRYKEDRTIEVEPVLEQLKGTKYHQQLTSIVKSLRPEDELPVGSDKSSVVVRQVREALSVVSALPQNDKPPRKAKDRKNSNEFPTVRPNKKGEAVRP